MNHVISGDPLLNSGQLDIMALYFMAHKRLVNQTPDTSDQLLAYALRDSRVFLGNERSRTDQIIQCLLGELQLHERWGCFSSSLPQVETHVITSSPLTTCPAAS